MFQKILSKLPRTNRGRMVSVAVVAGLIGVFGLGAVLGGSPTAQGVLVAYGFDNNNGTVTTDSSAAANNATLTGTTWTTGRFNSALNFNGTTSRARSNANISLPRTFTLEAWVLNPSASGYESIMTVGNARDLYLSNGALTFWTGNRDYSFNYSLPVNTWTHVALTYDGTYLRAYVDGVQRGSNQRVTLAATAAPLQVGAWMNGSGNYDFFSGNIDEVEVYSRALSAAQIQTDMTTPITGSGGQSDVTPPVLSNGLPGGVLHAGTTQVDLQVTTNETAACRYSTTATQAYSSMLNTFTATNSTAHVTTVSGMQDGASYTYYVRCQDVAGNVNGTDYPISFSVATESTTPPPSPTPPPVTGGYSLRFFGTGSGDIDRVKIPLTTNKTVDVATNFTIEWWMKAASGNNSDSCGQYNDSWINGNIIFDRDVYGGGDYGDYGISMFSGGIINFGVSRGSSGTSVCSTVGVADGLWHHVAATRNSSNGQMCIYVDGTQRGCRNGPTGDVSYRDGRSSSYANDPYLVFGAEKHDAGSSFPSYSGWLDEVRISNTVRYTANFTRPSTALSADSSTVALYHFDEGTGITLGDTTSANNGTLRVGGASNGPQWSTDKPF